MRWSSDASSRELRKNVRNPQRINDVSLPTAQQASQEELKSSATNASAVENPVETTITQSTVTQATSTEQRHAEEELQL